MNFGFRFKDEELSDFETVDPQIIAKTIEERKKVEESDHQLTNDLFSLSPNEIFKEDITINKKEKCLKPPKNPKNKNLKIDVAMINQTYKKIKTNYAKTTLAKEKDIFGEASLDDIDQLAYKIEEAYLYSLE